MWAFRYTAGVKFIGDRLLRKEDPRLVQGRGRYVGDIALPGMLHAAIVRSPHADARAYGRQFVRADYIRRTRSTVSCISTTRGQRRSVSASDDSGAAAAIAATVSSAR